MYVCNEGGACMPQLMCGGQKTNLCSQVSCSTLTRALAIDFKLPGFHRKQTPLLAEPSRQSLFLFWLVLGTEPRARCRLYPDPVTAASKWKD